VLGVWVLGFKVWVLRCEGQGCRVQDSGVRQGLGVLRLIVVSERRISKSAWHVDTADFEGISRKNHKRTDVGP
jgi:hypothetical protein